MKSVPNSSLSVKRPLAELEAANAALTLQLTDIKHQVSVLTDALIALTAHFDTIIRGWEEEEQGGLRLQDALDASGDTSPNPF